MRLAETPEVLSAIQRKAYSNAVKLGTYGKRAVFESGRVVVTLETVLSKHLSR